MQVVTQNKIGTITLTESVIRQSIIGYVQSNPNYKIVNFTINENENNRYIFVINLTTSKFDKMVEDIDTLVSYIQKQIEKNLQLFGSTIIVKINN
jgi:hypothetical protein